MKKFGIRIGDIIIFSLCLTGLLGSYVMAGSGIFNRNTSDQKMLQISNPDGEWIYPLDQELEITVQGPIGISHVHIESGIAWISDSPCKNKLCITAGEIDSFNSWVACLPNEIFIQIIGAVNEEGIDDLSF
jgi:hypothetical protein